MASTPNGWLGAEQGAWVRLPCSSLQAGGDNMLMWGESSGLHSTPHSPLRPLPISGPQESCYQKHQAFCSPPSHQPTGRGRHGRQHGMEGLSLCSQCPWVSPLLLSWSIQKQVAASHLTPKLFHSLDQQELKLEGCCLSKSYEGWPGLPDPSSASRRCACG